ncbi:DUF423 domain-containing protein [Peteryoungia ipomoeae]|uniref:DUF423 domain-containing protein n=1 Tax=Peteryoungia ipomoeae TaxID=1210932 RepID=A0A4S8NWU4_9HYPH|nr:DUF423 domain-containing protein [Peteryoungia ipomoeae]THV21351.1 DUF423 domain-containing protein [Peteryoungia ipomoeae]
MDTHRLQKPLVLAAGLIGAMGVALAALASHAGGEAFLRPASMIALTHAPALLALGLAGSGLRMRAWTGAGLTLGILLFSGDLISRHFLGASLFPMAAPTGGMILILSWLALGLSALVTRPR